MYAEEPAQRRRITVSRIGVAVLCAEVSQRLHGRVSEASQGNRRGGAKARAVVEVSSAKAIVAPLRGVAWTGVAVKSIRCVTKASQRRHERSLLQRRIRAFL